VSGRLRVVVLRQSGVAGGGSDATVSRDVTLVAFSTTTGIALYAALIATGGLAVQLIREWRTWSTRVQVEMRRMTLAAPGEANEPVVIFTITNRSDHLVKITHLGTEPIRSGGKSLFFPAPLPAGIPGPFPVPPHDSITLYQPDSSLPMVSPSTGHALASRLRTARASHRAGFELAIYLRTQTRRCIRHEAKDGRAARSRPHDNY